MASPILHIKDSYYFEVPKFLWRCDYADKADFPSVWVKNDPQYQDWEAHLLYEQLPTLAKEGSFTVPSEAELMSSYHAWRDHEHANFGKPFDSYLETQADWFKPALENLALKQKWELTKDRLAGPEAVQAYKKETSIEWSDDKIAAYNRQLSGKILIPQPFGELRNMYERESGICISRFMIIEVVVFLIMVLIFSRLAKRIATGERPRGRVWNFFETFLLFIRDEIARSAIHDDHHHGHGDEAHGGHEHGSHEHDGHAHHGHAHDEHASAGGVAHHPQTAHAAVATAGHATAGHEVAHAHTADKFVPLLWTIFFFVLFSNLMGMLPWVGAPTGSFSVTLGLAAVSIGASILFGKLKFGFFGFWINQVPQMDLPLPLAVILKPGIFLIEVLGFFIKHGVLAVRLLANMVAGHLVLLAIMMLAFSAEGARSEFWSVTAVISVLASTAFSVLELFVAFLQAYLFTFLTALFIGAATSRH